MKPLPRAVAARELLDAPQHDAAELQESLGHVAAVNRWLGGERSVMQHLRHRLLATEATRILDVATGSADLPLRIAEWARHHTRTVRIVATDLHPQMREVAAARTRHYPEITIESADARALPYADRSFDIALLTLALHHFDDAAQVQVLRELARVARRCVIISDLQRTRLNYWGAKLLAWTYWRGNRLTRHDGPLSVRRAFTPDELQNIAESAELRGTVHRHFFQRLVLVIDQDTSTYGRRRR